MNKVIKINENQLKRLVKEALDELKYSTYKSAHDKMQDKGQMDRAEKFNKTFKDVYDDENTSFNLPCDMVWLSNPQDKESARPANSTLFHRDGSMSGYENGVYRDFNAPQRTTNRALARKHANKLNFFYGGESPYDKNDFIAECVNNVLKKYLG